MVILKLFIVMIPTVLMNCQGWAIAGYSLDQEEYESTAFIEITAQDSSVHWYKDIKHGDNWCYFHNDWENVEVK